MKNEAVGYKGHNEESGHRLSQQNLERKAKVHMLNLMPVAIRNSHHLF